jgi:Mrp family chromosome partitioning ATPase/capsular polysaccharide biosynthesis protein
MEPSMSTTQADSPDIRAKLEPYRRRWLLIAIVVVAVSGATYKYYEGKPVQYSATTTLFVRGGSLPIVGLDKSEIDPLRRLQNEATLVDTPIVAQRVAQRLGYTGDPNHLLGQVTATPSANSDFITITAVDAVPRRAAELANGFAQAFVALSSQAGDANALPGAAQVAPATVPTASDATSPKSAALFAAALGLVLAVLLVNAIEAFDRRLRHPVVAAEYELPLLASLPYSRKARKAARAGTQMPVILTERIRGLRTQLDHASQGGTPPASILITSAIPGEGKSTLVRSLALAYFESGRSVLLIDADLRRPTLHELFEAPIAPGLTDVVRGAVSLSAAVQEVHATERDQEPGRPLVGSQVEAGSHAGVTLPSYLRPRTARGSRSSDGPVLHLLASGSGTFDPNALVGSAQLSVLIEDARSAYDIVLMDSPPALVVSDAIALAPAVDGVIIVARAEFTTRDAAKRCREALTDVPGVVLLGVVANAVRAGEEYTKPYYKAP